jgi:diketogulonate reductase-like aldo/keto reductase
VSPHNFKRAALLKAADGSLKRLKVDYIDLYQLHWPNPDVPIQETMEAMEYLVIVGKVRFIGVSNFSAAQLQTAQEATAIPIVSNQVEYSLIARCIESELLPYCQANGVTIIAYSPFSYHFNNILERDKEGAIRNVASTMGKTHAQVVLNWSLRKNSVVAIPKSNSIGHVEENCLASDWNMPSRSLALLEEAFPVGYCGIYSRN